MRYFLLVIILLLLWFFAGSFVVETKNVITYGVSQILLWPKWWVRGLISPALTFKQQEDLKLKNENLKAKLFRLRQNQPSSTPSFQGEKKDEMIVAKIHSSYPFNNKNMLSINKGRRDGVNENMVATVGGNILIGKVEAVFNNYSLVKTIFSNNWQLPIRIGSSGIEALLNGGPELMVDMIVKDKNIKNGQTVFATSKDFPYGIKIGELHNVQRGPAVGVFQKAEIKVPYNFNDLTEVWLLKSF